MSSSLTLFFFFFAFTFLYTSSYSFNITNILNQHNDFSTFNNLLTQTQLASTINNHKPITVLAVSNAGVSALAARDPAFIKKILSLHVVLDYYDEKKLKSLNGKSVILTTLFQSSGQAEGQQGFLNATVLKNGDVLIGSAVPGDSIINVQLLEPVMSQPYNISVLHLSSLVMINIRPDNGPPLTPPPLPAQPPNDDDYEYDEPPSPPSPPSSAPAAVSPHKATAKIAPASGVSGIDSRPAFAFALVMTSIWWFMT